MTILILIYAFFNGFNDSCIVVATIIATRATSVKTALMIAGIGNMAGPFIFGTAVAKTIGEGFFRLHAFKIEAILFAVISAIIWSFLTWYLGIPSSSSHTIMGSLLGASIVFNGLDAIILQGFYKILLFLLISPIVGYLCGFAVSKIIRILARNARPRAGRILNILQIPLSLVVAISHGANDSQKTTSLMGMIFFIFGLYPNFKIPLWMIAANALAISAGTVAGGGRIIKTLGQKIYKIRPLNGFSSQLSSALIIGASSVLGGPVSSTHVMTSVIAGSGASESVKKIRWITIYKIIFVLFSTIPATALFSMFLSYLYILIKGWLS